MVALMVSYRQGPPFDADYYTSRHLPLAERVLKPLGLVKEEVRRDITNMDGSPGPYHVIASLYFPSMEALQAALKHPSVAEVTKDIKNFYPAPAEYLIVHVAGHD